MDLSKTSIIKVSKMRTFQNDTIKYRQFISDIRFLNLTPKQGAAMTTQETATFTSRSTGGNSSNKRYKRTPEELDMDIAKVDELVASGKYNQIEALNHMRLQSSVYHYRKRNAKEAVAKSLKPRKSSEKTLPNRETYLVKKAEFKKNEEVINNQSKVETNDAEMQALKTELLVIKQKYAKLQEYVVENIVLR